MTRRFALGFMIGLLAFILINLFSAHFSSDCGLLAVFERDSCADDVARAGWPFRFYEKGGLDFRFDFNPLALFFDLIIAVILASALGWLFARKAT
jgi:ABC-type antimicrobial peptide transport system permease subunit